MALITKLICLVCIDLIRMQLELLISSSKHLQWLIVALLLEWQFGDLRIKQLMKSKLMRRRVLLKSEEFYGFHLEIY